MKAIRVREFGGPAVLKIENVPDPTPGPGQVVIAIKAAGVNPVDTVHPSRNVVRENLRCPTRRAATQEAWSKASAPMLRVSNPETVCTSAERSPVRMRKRHCAIRHAFIRCRNGPASLRQQESMFRTPPHINP